MTPLPSLTTKHSQPQAPTSPPGSGFYPGDGGGTGELGCWGKPSSLPWAPGCPFRDSVPRPEYGVTQVFCLQMACTTIRIIYMSFHQQGNVHLSVPPPPKAADKESRCLHKALCAQEARDPSPPPLYHRRNEQSPKDKTWLWPASGEGPGYSPLPRSSA